LAKNTRGIGNDWDMHLNAVQLALNNQISKKLNSTPFSLFFARKMAEPYGFRSDEHNSLAPEHRQPMSHEELMKRIDYMTDIVFPAIHAKSIAHLELEKARFDNSHTMADFKPGNYVMIRLQTKEGQLAPAYTGPYTVIRKNRGNAYILRDHTGELMPRNYTSTELKLVSHDEVIELDDEGNEIKHHELEAVLNHRGEPTEREYLVRFKNLSSDYDEWIPQDHFNATSMLRNYWKKLGIPYKPKSNALVPPISAAQALKKTPPGSVTKLLDSLIEENDNDINPKPARRFHKRPSKKGYRSVQASSPKIANAVEATSVAIPDSISLKRKDTFPDSRRSKRQPRSTKQSSFIYD
jgi:hypothetical protein